MTNKITGKLLEGSLDKSEKFQDILKDLANKLELLKTILRSFGSVAVAFSGGVDSTFLLKIAADVMGEKVIAFTMKSAAIPERELKKAVSIAKAFRVRQVIIETSELENPDFTKNDELRCYHCKKNGFKQIIDFAKKNNVEHVIDGQNTDDFSDYRPGSKAAEELGVKSPLSDAGMSKQDIRITSRQLNIKGWDRPPLACLASRIPYGTEISVDLLEKIDNLENFLIRKGLTQVRVRHHNEIARIEILKVEFPLLFSKNLLKEIVSEFRKYGYLYTTLDLEGYRTGSLNEIFVLKTPLKDNKEGDKNDTI